MTKSLTGPNRAALAVSVHYAPMINVLINSLSASSRRQYEHTFNDWRAWCASNLTDPLELSAPNVLRYLQTRNLSRATKQSRLTHLRRLVQTLYSADTTNTLFETYYTQLKLLRLSLDENHETSAKGRKRPGKRLDGDTIHELIVGYPIALDGKPHLRGLRNRALLAVLFYAGLRRFEACKLKWADIDFEQEHIAVVGGKGRQRNEVQYVPFLGGIARHLQAWKAHMTDRVYVFPRVLKGGHLGLDAPITPDGLYKQFEVDFAPHDARRTLISDLIESGTYIGDVKQIARHASESTTLRYAKANDIKIVKKRAKLGY
ncbi:MAG: site-specific integrase [Anaerolineae bacterium]